MSINAKLFRNKTIKFERKIISEKKSENYDIIGNTHKDVMNSFKHKQCTLPMLNKQIFDINAEIEMFSTEDGIHALIDKSTLTLENLTFRRSQYNITIVVNNEIIINTTPIKAKKAIKKNKPNIMIQNDNEEKDQCDILDKSIQDETLKLKMLSRIFTRNSYVSDLKKQRNKIKDQITNIEENQDELEYFGMNIDILNSYYSAPENTEENTEEYSVLDFFNRPKTIDNKTIERHLLVERYLQTMNGPRRYKKPNLGRICKKCNIPKLLNNQEGTFTCEICAEVEFVLMDPDKPSYNSGSEQKNNTYRRINHCTEILNQSQGKESTDIDDELMADILEEINVRNIMDLSTITKEDIKSILKSIGMSSKSEHATHIANKLNGIPIRTIPYHLIEIVKVMWKMIEEAWVKIKDVERKNFMNSSFLFHKIFELLDEPEEANKWSYLAPDKLKKYDVDWENICEFWNWAFIRSV